ncbi:MAG: FecR domain-containing protein [Bacteroidetes bacterium]|nr:FecR domain-containing protein [Bacteroidota bacterium]
MNQAAARRLLDAYLAGSLSEAGRDAFVTLLDDPAQAEWLVAEMKASFADDRYLGEEPDDRKKRLNGLIATGIKAAAAAGVPPAEDAMPITEVTPVIPMHRAPFLRRARLRYAAVMLLALGAAVVVYRAYRQPGKDITRMQPLAGPADIPAGGNRAVLTLADGSRIVLDSAAAGKVASQGATQITKLDSGALAYHPGGRGEQAIGVNTISTPRGGQYRVVLPDGSVVWLNAESSVTFPTAFGKERSVSMKGEAYFEVKTDAGRPFTVTTAQGQMIQVLGTSFNANTYTDENIQRTTLLEGKIRVLKNGDARLPAAGEQVCLNIEKGTQTVVKADVAQTMAWKNGIFNLEGATVPEVMRQLARWYDIEVVYENGVPDISFGGKMERSLPLSGIVTALTNMGVHLRMEAGNKRLVILQ